METSHGAPRSREARAHVGERLFLGQRGGRGHDDGVGPEAMRLSDVVYYKIAEHLDEPEVEEDMSRAEIFLVASHREFRAYKFYSELAMLYDTGDAVHDMLHKIANEELKHKEKMEYLYANTAFPQTDGG